MTARALTILLTLMSCCAAALGENPAAEVEPPAKAKGVDWSALAVQSLTFLGIEHGFRWVTEDGTRHPHRPFFDGYVDSLNNLHGWADGDPFYVNYVGHPMQGAVTGFLWVQNDRSYRTVEFGKDRRYWKGRLRAGAFAWAYSEQFEIGPLSEASIGHIQSSYPQQGFVDQVTTPAIGFAWMLAEDALDRYMIKRFEGRVHNPYARLLVRGGLNPARSLSNLVAGQLPWHRDTRGGVWESSRPTAAQAPAATSPPQAIPPFEFLATTRAERYVGPASRGACIGGGGAAAFRVAPHWQIVGDVSGCKFTNFGANLSGDSLTYLIGPRWVAAPLSRWQPYAQIMAGGRTMTHELVDPAKEAQLAAAAAREGRTLTFSDRHLFARESEITGVAISFRAGVDLKLTSAIAIRIADVGFTHSRHAQLDGVNYSNALQLTSGLILRLGTW